MMAEPTSSYEERTIRALQELGIPVSCEHHTGRAIDIGTPGCPPVTEAFEQTPAFGWLTQRGREFGFRMTYPRGNPFGVIYEPWHWVHESEARPGGFTE